MINNIKEQLRRDEVIVPIDGFDGYLVTNIGRVYSLGGRSNVNLDGMWLKAPLNKKGYPTVVFGKCGKRPMRVHRLVALAFIENPDNKDQVNHKDGDKTNNCVGNLEWVTNTENRRHALDHLPSRTTQKVRDSASRLMREHGIKRRLLSMKDAATVRQEAVCGASTVSIAEKYKVASHVIRRIVRGETYRD